MPLLATQQSQKDVTHNDAIRRLDALVQLSVIDRDLTAAPGSPAEGDRYIVASGATGVWDDWDLNIAAYLNGGWVKLVPREGWLVFVTDENALVTYREDTGAWQVIAGTETTVAAISAHGAQMQFRILEELIATSSGATKDSTILIPNGSIVLNVSERVVTTITGATSFSCGISGEAGKFGSGLGVAAGSTNKGVIGPTGFYADTAVRLTAAGGNFSGGSVRIAICYYLPVVPTS